jgi:hypothetical protein
MNNSTDKPKPIGFLRNKTSKKGVDFLTGMVEVGGEKVNLVVFKNTKKFTEDSPDYSIFVSQPLQNAGGGGYTPAPQKPRDISSEDNDPIPF